MQIAHKNEQRVRKNVVTLHCQIKTNKVSSSLSGTQKEVIMDIENYYEDAKLLVRKKEMHDINTNIGQASNASSEKDLLKQSAMEYLEAKASGEVRSETKYGKLTIIEL